MDFSKIPSSARAIRDQSGPERGPGTETNDGGVAMAALNGGEVSSQYLKGYPSTS